MGSSGTAGPQLPEDMELPEPLEEALEEPDAVLEALLLAPPLLPRFITRI